MTTQMSPEALNLLNVEEVLQLQAINFIVFSDGLSVSSAIIRLNLTNAYRDTWVKYITQQPIQAYLPYSKQTFYFNVDRAPAR